MKPTYETRGVRSICRSVASIVAIMYVTGVSIVPLPSHATDRSSVADARCVIVASRMVTLQDAQQRGAGMLLAMFYLGRLEARNGYAEERRLILEEAKSMTVSDLRSAAMRCGKALQEEGVNRRVTMTPRIASRNFVTGCLTSNVTDAVLGLGGSCFPGQTPCRLPPSVADVRCEDDCLPGGEGDMLTRRADGSISGEATTQSGNILPEAMRTIQAVRTRCVAAANETAGSTAAQAVSFPVKDQFISRLAGCWCPSAGR